MPDNKRVYIIVLKNKILESNQEQLKKAGREYQSNLLDLLEPYKKNTGFIGALSKKLEKYDTI